MGDSGTEKKAISFGFSKLKPKTTLAKPETSLFKAELPVSESDKPELITSIDKNKITSLNKPVVDNRPLVIPCPKNRDIVGSHKKAKDLEAAVAEGASSKGSADDVAAVRALIEQAKNSKNDGKDDGLVIEQKETVVTVKELDKVEDPNYEAIDLEKFGNFLIVNFEKKKLVVLNVTLNAKLYDKFASKNVIHLIESGKLKTLRAQINDPLTR
jgi:hypothetical protein